MTKATDATAQGNNEIHALRGPLWTILIATLSYRQDRFLRLLGCLLPQCETAGNVDVVACSNDAEEPIGSIRQRLLMAAAGDYVSFIDDDDMVPSHFVETIVPLLADTPDIVGFNVAMTVDGQPANPSYLSIRFEPHDAPDAYYRDITHVQPIRRELALRGDFRAAWPEDNAWRNSVRPLVRTEQYVDQALYFYRHDPRDSVQYGIHHHISPRPRHEIDSPAFRYLDWSPNHATTARDQAEAPTGSTEANPAAAEGPE